MLDVIICLKTLHKRINNCQVILDGLDSDHRAVHLDLVLTSIKFKETQLLFGSAIDWRKILTNDECCKLYKNAALEATPVDMDYEEFNNAIRQSGMNTAISLKERCKGWYEFSQTELMPIIEVKNQLVHTLRQKVDPMEIDDLLQCSLKRVTKQVKDMVLLAKLRWYSNICLHIHDMHVNPWLAWEYIRILTGGKMAHHKKLINMAMRLHNGTLASNSSENMVVFGLHFERMFSNHQPVDLSILDLIPKREQLMEIDHPIMLSEVDKAINKLKPGKAPGLNGIPPEAYKAFRKKMRMRIHRYVGQFFDGTRDYDGWHKSQCVPVPQKGNLADPNKWKGIMLMDVCSKIFSLVMNNFFFCLLELHGTRFQFGGTPEVGCRNGLFTLKSLLSAQCNHDLGSYVGFVDLVKAYDTANHELLFCLLEKYGAPPTFVTVIRKIYTSNVVVFKIKKEVREIPQEVGVRQGDNMAPVLFLFLMTAFTETLELGWKCEKIKVVTTMIAADDEIQKGQLCSHTSKIFRSKILSAYEIFQCLSVDDGAFPFDTRESLSQGMTLVHRHFVRFGLEMHIGRNGGESKMECVFFPPPQFFQQCQLPTIGDNQRQTRSMTTRTSTDAP
jgi:hypothetical protein